jgi:hypothetical protein
MTIKVRLSGSAQTDDPQLSLETRVAERRPRRAMGTVVGATGYAVDLLRRYGREARADRGEELRIARGSRDDLSVEVWRDVARALRKLDGHKRQCRASRLHLLDARQAPSIGRLRLKGLLR